MAILGLINTETLSTERFKNHRREVFYTYPNGAAPLTGILSLQDEETTDDPEFSWNEKRHKMLKTLTAANVATGPFADTSNVDKADPFSLAADGIVRIAVVDASVFRVGHEIVVRNVDINASALNDELHGVVTAVFSDTSPQRIEIRAIAALAAIENDSANVGVEVEAIGSAFAQGQRDISSGIYNLPVRIFNNCQIFKAPFTTSGTALKTSLKYDETGVYRDQAKETAVQNAIEQELAFIFGKKSKYVDSDGQVSYTTNGIIEHLKLWEAGATYGNDAATSNSDDNKRIIDINGNISESALDGYLERAFRRTNNKANEKLVLCGSGFLNVMNQLYKSKSVLNSDIPTGDTYGMNVVKHVTPFGTLFYKTHPLFNESAALRFNALILDVMNLKYRYVTGRDMALLKDREENDADYKKSEWVGECGLEFRFPESCMYFKGVTGYAT